MLWGTIALAFGLVFQSLIPYAYTFLTIFNLYYFYKSKDFKRVRFIQILLSLMLPFLFQWSLGGFFSSGTIMLWALLALVASPSFQSPRSSIIWLVLYIFLTAFSAVFEDFFYTFKPDILGDQSLLFVSLNAGVIGSIVFFLVVYFVQRSNDARSEVQMTNADLKNQRQLLFDQKDTLQSAIVETNEIIKEAVNTGNFDVRMNVEDKVGEWQDLAKSINRLFDAIVTPLNIVRHIAGCMSKGDLSHRYEDDANGQILLLKDSINESLDQFSELLKQISYRTNDIGKSSEEMQQTSQQMNQGTTEINTAIGEISHGSTDQLMRMDEASNLISTIADAAKSIDSQAQAINKKAQDGVNRSDKAIKSVRELTEEVGKNYESSNVLLENCRILTEESKSISSFTGLIREIAAQTNLLSLNAGIQAADAGEHGQGFGVVAEEIRLLADRAKGSVEEIDGLITGIQNRIVATQETVAMMNGSIEQNKEVSEKILDDFTELSEGLRAVDDESKIISEATRQQNDDLGEIVKLTENIVTIAEESATSSKEVAAATTGLSTGMDAYTVKSQELLEIARELNEKTKRFILDSQDKAS